jgi:hypothetical protein
LSHVSICASLRRLFPLPAPRTESIFVLGGTGAVRPGVFLDMFGEARQKASVPSTVSTVGNGQL